MKHVVKALFTLCLLACTQMQAGINFGGRESAIDVTGGTLALGSGKTLNDGVLRDSGGSITATSAACSGMVVETTDGTTTKLMKTDGTLTLSGTPALVLGDNEILIVDGGQVVENITVNGSDEHPSIIQGSGSFDAAITVSDEKELLMRWQGAVNQNITLTPSTVSTSSQLTLEDDLTFANGHCPSSVGGSGTAKVNFAGYKISLGGVTSFGDAQSWDTAHIALSGDTTIDQNITMTTSAAVIEGNGYKLTVSGGFLGSVGGTLGDVHIPSYDSGVFGGTGNWSLRNVILSDSDEMIRVNDGQLTAGTADIFAGAATWSAASNIELLKDLTLVDEWQFDGAAHINGNGFSLKFTDTDGTIDYDGTLSLSNMILSNVTAASFDNDDTQSLRLRGVEWHDGAQAGSVRFGPSPLVDQAQYAELTLADSATAGALFAGAVIYPEGAQIDLLSNTTLSSTWTFQKKTVVNGNGHVLTFADAAGILKVDSTGGTNGADLYLNNIILGDVDSDTFDNTGGVDLYLNNVTWIEETASKGAIRVTASTEATVGAAQVSFPTSSTEGDIFDTAVTWVNGANIELLSDVTMGAVWTFSENTIINGHGHVIDLASVAGALTIAENKTLTINNAVIKSWGSTGEIAFANNNATLALSNVTIIMDSSISGDDKLGANEKITVNGPLTIVTGTYTFDASTADSSNNINSVTVWYDTLGNPDTNQVTFGSFSGGGQIAMLPLADDTGVTTFSASADHVSQSLFLSYDIDVSDDGILQAVGKQIELDNTSSFVLKGNGRSLYMAPAPISSDTLSDPDGAKLVVVDNNASNVVEVHDLIFDGWAQAHFNDANNLIRYCTGTVIKLQADQALTQTLNFSVAANSGETVVLDLNGCDFDMGSDDAALAIPATDATVTIKNGRIINFDDNSGSPKLTCGGSTSTWVFQDVDLVLAANTTFSGNNITFKGDCTITGTGRTDDVTNPTTFKATFSDVDVTISDGARLTIDKGIALVMDGYNTNFDSSLTFGSRNSTLSFIGSTLDVSGLSADPAFLHGALRIDDKVTVIAGSRTLTLGGAGSDELELDIMPAARMVVSSGTVSYANAS